jgi:hypothetical protein
MISNKRPQGPGVGAEALPEHGCPNKKALVNSTHNIRGIDLKEIRFEDTRLRGMREYVYRICKKVRE